MDCQDYITELVERKKGQHLQREERGAIQYLKNAGYTNGAIARAIGCSPTTVGNELKRGTPPRKSSKGRKPGYPFDEPCPRASWPCGRRENQNAPCGGASRVLQGC